MNLRLSVAVVFAASVLALAGCSGAPSSGGDPSEGGSSSMGADPTEGGAETEGGTDAGVPSEWRGVVSTVDMGGLGARLEGWEGCDDEPIVDMAGYPSLTCIFPDEYAVPGQTGNAVVLSSFDEWSQADTYMAEYGTPGVTVVEDGYIVDGPHSKAVDAAVEILRK